MKIKDSTTMEQENKYQKTNSFATFTNLTSAPDGFIPGVAEQQILNYYLIFSGFLLSWFFMVF